MPRGSHAHHVTIPASTADVWLRFQEPETWRGIGPIDEIRDVRLDGERLTGFAWSTHIGPTRYRGTSTMLENIPGERLVMKLSSSEMAGALKVRLSPNGDGTEVAVVMEFVTRGPMSSLFFPVISDAIRNGLTSQVDAFAAGWSD